MVLHILNGDATLRPLKASGLQGDVVTWREILSEGPVKNIPDKQFFDLRSDYICKNFSETPAGYSKKVIDEFSKIKNNSQYETIYLWFEHDLVCQINLLFLLHTLSENRSSKIYAVRFYDNEEHRNKYKGFGAISGDQMKERFQHTIEFDKESIAFALSCWEAYAGNDPLEIGVLIPAIPEEKLPFLKDSLTAHLKRFPSTFNGLNNQQNMLLKILSRQPLPLSEVIEKFLRSDSVYGTTDLMLMKMIEQLSPELVTMGKHVSITENGTKVLAGDKDLFSIKHSLQFIGGYHLNSDSGFPRWNHSQKTLVIED